MSDEELRVMERNRRLTRHIMVPLMLLLGGSGVVGGIFAITQEVSEVGIGLTSSALIMLLLGWFYARDTRKPIERPEKFFVSGVITDKRKTGSAFTTTYHEIKLNGGKYTCFINEKDFKKLKPGDVVQCERLEENSLHADRVVLLKGY